VNGRVFFLSSEFVFVEESPKRKEVAVGKLHKGNALQPLGNDQQHSRAVNRSKSSNVAKIISQKRFGAIQLIRCGVISAWNC